MFAFAGRAFQRSILSTAVYAVVVLMQPAHAQQYRLSANAGTAANQQLGTIGERINANTLAIVSGNINAAWLTIAYDLSAVLDDGENLRIVPIIGRGGSQNVRDVRFLRGVDLGITVTSVLGHYRRSGELGNIDDKIVYITKLFDDEMHLLVDASSGVTSIEQLRGKKVNFSDIGSATQVSARDVFERLNVSVQKVNMGQLDAYEKMKIGEIAATVQFGAKPAPAIQKLTAAAGFRLLPVHYVKPLQQDFLPSSLTSEDYPGLIEAGRHIETIAYGAVIIAYNWPKGSDRYRRIETFVDACFSKLAEFQKPPRHPKWKEVNLATVLPGVKRFEAAEEWLRRYREQQGGGEVQIANRDRFEQFLNARGTERASGTERDRLFEEFLKVEPSARSPLTSDEKRQKVGSSIAVARQL